MSSAEPVNAGDSQEGEWWGEWEWHEGGSWGFEHGASPESSMCLASACEGGGLGVVLWGQWVIWACQRGRGLPIPPPCPKIAKLLLQPRRQGAATWQF